MLVSDGLQLDEGNSVKVAVVVTSSFQSQGKELLTCFVLVIRIVSRSRIVSRVAQINVVWTKQSALQIVTRIHLAIISLITLIFHIRFTIIETWRLQENENTAYIYSLRLKFTYKLCKLIIVPTHLCYFTQCGWRGGGNIRSWCVVLFIYYAIKWLSANSLSPHQYKQRRTANALKKN